MRKGNAGPLLLIGFSTLLSSCASLFNKRNQSLSIISTPPGAAVFVNGTEAGTTPYKYTYDASAGDKLSVELRMEGRQPVALEIKPGRKNAVLFADAMLLGIPYIADAKSAAMYSFPYPEAKVNLYKALPVDRQVLDLPVTVMENALQGNAALGKIGTHSLKLDSKELSDLRYPESATSAIIEGMANTYVAPHGVRLGTAKGDADALQAKVVLRPLLKGLDLQLKESGSRVFGNARMDMAWRFYSGIDKDSLLFTLDKSTDWPVNGSYARDVFADALKDAARQLLDDDSLYNRIAAVHAAGILRSKGDLLRLSRPAPIPFADRNAMIPALVKGVVTVEMKDGHGSGFLITSDGYIITNAHVVGTSATAKVRFEQGFSLDGQVVKVNRDFDVALIKVPGNDLPALSLGNDADVQLGQELYAIGTPLDEKLGQTVTRGIMSGKRELDGHKYLQTDVSINPGNSGGPLITNDGKVVGVATLKIKATGVEGIGFGVPITTALEMLNIEFTK